jgi:hypothetical protein
LKTLFIIHCSLFIVHYSLYSQIPASSSYDNNRVRIVFYNTENLFDTHKDSVKNDIEFTPGAIRRWNPKRYYKKLNNISKVIIAAGEWEAPGIIGLSEVENKIVLLELIHKTPLKKFDYSIVHFDSPDERGLDVALLYRPEIMKPLFCKPIQIRLPNDSAFRTRDILYVKCFLINKDTLHLFVNHWPSRRDGKEVSEKRRIAAASILKEKVDSLNAVNKNANIVIMGDFNDEPADSSIAKVLKATCDCGLSTMDYGLINLMCQNKAAGEWTYRYNINNKLFSPQNDILDQLIVSCNLLSNPKGFIVKDKRAYIFKKDWLLLKDASGNDKPFSTYKGMKYSGGFSDHLPVYMDIMWK